MKSNLTTFAVEVKGRVQGVGYRAWVEKKARDFDLQGWVMNSEDKSVKMEISGKKKNIKIFLIECYKGPLLSKVLEVNEKEIPLKDFKSFEIRFK